MEEGATRAPALTRRLGMQQNGWIALGAASALGLGVLAGSAVTAATAMPLADASESVDVAPISDLRAEVKFFAGPRDGRVTVPGTVADPASAPAPAPTPIVTQAPAPQPVPVPVAPVAPAQSVATPDTPDDDFGDD